MLKIAKNYRKIQVILLNKKYKYIQERRLRIINDKIVEKNNEHESLIKNKIDIIRKRSQKRVKGLREARKRIVNNKSYFLGAKGEREVIEKLRELPDSYIVINNFKKRFNKAIHRKKKGDWIKSIQIDHIVVGPTGLFVIETKNWSNESLKNTDYHSPVDQVERFGHALFVYLNKKITLLNLFNKNWNKYKIKVKNIIAVKHKPKNIKLKYNPFVRWRDLTNYITYGNKRLSPEEVNILVNILGGRDFKKNKDN